MADTQIYKVRDPSGAIREIRGPVGATDEEVIAQAQALFSGKEEQPQKPKYSQDELLAKFKKDAINEARERNPILSKVADIGAGMTTIPRGVVGMISPELSQKLWPTEVVDKESGAYLAGQIADPYALLIGAKGMQLANVARKAPLVGKTIASSPVIRGMLGGGIGGASIGALSEDQNAEDSGLFGGAIGGLVPVVGKGLGYAWDRLKGNTQTLRAQNIIKDTFGDKIDQARSLWKRNPDIPVAQATARTGSITGAALGARAARQNSQYFADVAKAQAAARRADVASVAGGKTQQASLAARESKKNALTQEWLPKVETELAAADAWRKYGLPLQRQSESMGDMATSKVEDVRRLTGAGDIAQNKAQDFYPVSGMPRIAGRYSYADELAKRAEGAASVAADESLLYGDASRFAQSRMDSLKAHGLEPLDTSSVRKSIGMSIADPKHAGNKTREKALSNVVKEIDNWTERGGGIIDARALYAIRRNAINSVVEQRMKGLNPNQIAATTAKAVAEIKPVIDAAIVKAGGSKWISVLKEYENGARVIDRMKLGAKALKMFDKNPDDLIRLIKNESPDVVQKIFKTESDVAKAMLEGYKPLARVGKQLDIDKMLAERANKGVDDLAKILKEDSATIKMFPKLISWKLSAAKQIGDVAEEALNKKTMNKVYFAMRSGKNAEEIMSIIPAKERVQFLNVLYSGKATPYTMGAQTAATGDNP